MKTAVQQRLFFMIRAPPDTGLLRRSSPVSLTVIAR
jgi:hypothetical protein